MKFTGERVVPTDMHGHIDTYQQHLLRYVWALKYVVNKNVIDAACGTGYGSALMATVASKVVGLDISREAVAYASRRYPEVEFFRENLDATESFDFLSTDVIVTFETIEHLEDPQRFIDWCKKTAPVVIGSIPINCPTEFHLHNYTFQQALDFISKNFENGEIWHQIDMEPKPVKEPINTGMLLFVGRR